MPQETHLSVELVSFVATNNLDGFYMTLYGAQVALKHKEDPKGLALYTLHKIVTGEFGPIAPTPWGLGGAPQIFTRHNRVITHIEWMIGTGNFNREQICQFATGYFLTMGYPRLTSTLEAIEEMLRLKFPRTFPRS